MEHSPRGQNALTFLILVVLITPAVGCANPETATSSQPPESKPSTQQKPTPSSTETMGVDISKIESVDMDLKKKQEIFYLIVKYEDQGLDSAVACKKAAQEYKISKEEAQNIALEGAVKRWPMPPEPSF